MATFCLFWSIKGLIFGGKVLGLIGLLMLSGPPILVLKKRMGANYWDKKAALKNNPATAPQMVNFSVAIANSFREIAAQFEARHYWTMFWGLVLIVLSTLIDVSLAWASVFG